MIERLVYFFIFFILCSCCRPAFGQKYNFNVKKYTIDDGLSNRAANTILQSSDGYIWIGTNQGLNRFDGYSFKFWTRSDNGLLNDQINRIYEDENKQLWLFSTTNSVSEVEIFDPVLEKGIAFSAKFKDQLPDPKTKLLGFFAVDNKGTIYMGTSSPSGVLKYNPKTGFKQIITKPGYYFYPQVVTGKNTLWGKFFKVGTPANQADIVEIDLKGNIINNLGKVNIKQPGNQYYSADGSFYYEKPITLDAPIQNWLHKADNTEMHFEKNDYTRKIFQPSPLWNFFKQNDLIGYENYFADTKTGKILLDLSANIPELKKHGFKCWMIDRSGLLWIGYDFGICRIEIEETLFRNFLFNGDNKTLGISCRGILPMQDGSIKVNTELKGQWSINKNTGSEEIINFYPHSFFYGLAKDKNNNLYNSISPYIIVRLTPDLKKNEFEWYGAQAWCFYNLDDTHLLIGTNFKGLAIFDLMAGKVSLYDKYNSFPELAHTSIYHIGKDESGKIWICSETGFYELDSVKGVIGRYWPGGKGKYYLPERYFLHYWKDKEGIFWLATLGSGLIKWDPAKNETIHYGRKSGLPVETVYAVYEDKHKHLWLPSDLGIIQFDKEKAEVRRIYDTGDGISHREFNRVSHAIDSSGIIYFGSLNGITSFDSEKFYGKSLNNIAPLHISDCFKYDGKLGRLVNISAEVLSTNTIRLKSNERYFSLDMALLTYREPSKIQYAYKFDNESEWHFQNDRTLRFEGFSYGNKKLQIKSQAANGAWSTNEILLDIDQKLPFYFQWWFVLLFILSILGIIRWRTHSLRVRQVELEGEIIKATSHIEEQAEKLRHLDKVKSRFFANVSHELRTPLTLIHGPIGTLIKKKSEDDEDYKLLKLAQNQSKDLLGLIKQLLDLGKLESDKLELAESTVNLQSTIMDIFNSFENNAERLGINYLINYHVQSETNLLLDAKKIETVLSNLISNALKFTIPGDSLIIEVEEKEEFIYVSVSDTGSGIHAGDIEHVFERYYQSNQPNIAESGGTGIGLALCKELIELMGGRIWVDSTLGVGSKFSFKFPKKSAFTSLQSVSTEINEEISTNGKTAETKKPVKQDTKSSDIEKPLILVVEDNVNLSEYLEVVLSSSYQVVLKENGEAGLKWLKENKAINPPELIISDIMMPVMDGFQLLSSIKNDDRFSNIPVIMLTARSNINDRLKALRIGVDDYLLKPFDDEELLIRVKNLIANYKVRKRYAEIKTGKPQAEPQKTKDLPKLNKQDQPHESWLEVLEQYVQEHLHDSNLSLEHLTDKFNLSRSAFYKQLKKLTGLSPTEYIDEARFYRARHLLETDPSLLVKEVAYKVGFIKVKHFSRRFHQRFGKYPSEYL